MRDTVQVFKDDHGEWRWRRLASNGLITAVSGEGYKNRQHAIRMARRVNRWAKVVVE